HARTPLYSDAIAATGPASPVAPADLLYCRLLLTHLPDPATAVARWATQLRPDGRLLIDEVESIETKHDVLRRYLALVADLVAHEGGELYIGPRLAVMT